MEVKNLSHDTDDIGLKVPGQSKEQTGLSHNMGLVSGFFHALYWVITLYIHRKEVLQPDEPSPIDYLPFNRLMYIRLIHFGLLGFCGIIMSFVYFLSRQANLAQTLSYNKEDCKDSIIEAPPKKNSSLSELGREALRPRRCAA